MLNAAHPVTPFFLFTKSRPLNHYVKLPFLAESKWPTSKEPEERVVNPSYDRQIQDGLVDELLIALERRDRAGFREAFHGLIRSVKSEGQEEESHG